MIQLSKNNIFISSQIRGLIYQKTNSSQIYFSNLLIRQGLGNYLFYEASYNKIVMSNSFTLDLSANSRLTNQRLSQRNAKTREKQSDTFDSGMATASQFRRYPQQEPMEADLGINLREMREKRRVLQLEYNKMANRIQYQRNKQEKMLNTTLNQQYKLQNSRHFQIKKEEQQKRTIELQQRKKFEKWAKSQQVEQLRKKLEKGKRASVFRESSRKKKQLELFKKRFNSEKYHFQRLRQKSVQQTRQKHNNILQMKEQQNLRKKILERKKDQKQKYFVIEKISKYEQQTAKTMALIDELKAKESMMEKRSRTCSKVLLNILDNFKKLQSL